MDYEYYYNNAKNKYYDACSEITNCNNYADELKIQQQNKVNEINDLEVTLKKYQDAYEQMTQIVRSEDTLNSNIQDISDDIDSAAENYTGMVISSTVTTKNLTDVYSDEISQEKLSLSDILECLNAEKSNLSDKIDCLNTEIQEAEDAVEAIKILISSNQSSLEDWRKRKSNASLDMEYYKRKMDAAASE